MTKLVFPPAVCLERFRNYCGPIKVARSGFLWEKTTKGDVASVYTYCETAVVEQLVRAVPQQATVTVFRPAATFHLRFAHARRAAQASVISTQIRLEFT
jgi:hypothetical protein